MKTLSWTSLIIAFAVCCKTTVAAEPQVTVNVTKVTEPTEQTTQHVKVVSTEKPEVVPDLTEKSGIHDNTDQPEQTTVQGEADTTINPPEDSTTQAPEIDEDYGIFEELDAQNSTLDHGDGRLVGGVAAVAAQFPFAAFVNGGANFRTCTGVIVSAYHILVPASCVAGVTAAALTVQVATITQAGGTGVTVIRVIVHPKYRYSPEEYNLALLRLTSVLAVANASPIPLASKTSTDDNKDIYKQGLTVIGFGPLTATGAQTDLRYIDLTILTKTECLRRLKGNSVVTLGSKQSCLDVSTSLGPCGQPDLGSIVIRRYGTATSSYTLIGIVTYINDCASNIPSIVTRVGPFYDWLIKYINNPDLYT